MGSSYFITYGNDRVTFGGPTGAVAWEAPRFEYKLLWSTSNPFRNLYSITLNDSIDNYDEYIVYGSASRGTSFVLDTENKYVVVKNTVNQGGCYYAGRWENGNTYILENGTEVRLSGNSGFVGSSYFIGQNNNSTAWASTVFNTARSSDIHPYKIIGVREVK